MLRYPDGRFSTYQRVFVTCNTGWRGDACGFPATVTSIHEASLCGDKGIYAAFTASPEILGAWSCYVLSSPRNEFSTVICKWFVLTTVQNLTQFESEFQNLHEGARTLNPCVKEGDDKWITSLHVRGRTKKVSKEVRRVMKWRRSIKKKNISIQRL
jgi:hypothetical protein